MSMPIMIPWEERDRNRPWTTRISTRIAIMAARVLVFLPPHRLRAVLERIRGDTRRPATSPEADAARRSVLSASLALNGLRACLPRSVAIALLCRLRGTWPTWCVGASAAPPFTPHAWVEVDSVPVDELDADVQWSRLIIVAPRGAERAHRIP